MIELLRRLVLSDALDDIDIFDVGHSEKTQVHDTDLEGHMVFTFCV